VVLALALLGAAQAAAVLTAPLPGGAGLTALPNGYSYATRGDSEVLIGFQMRNTGDRPLRLLDLGADLPGLRLVDVVGSGDPFDYRSAGEGEAALPPFRLAADAVVEITLVYRLEACSSVPEGRRPMPVRVRSGQADGTLKVPLPTAPSDDEDAGPDDEDEWQEVLVRDLCG
jgi:hypothetical protein